MTTPEQAAPRYVLLHTLPQGHALRSRPLLGSQCRNVHSKEWRNIGSSWGIARASYEQVAAAWAGSTEFRVAVPA